MNSDLFILVVALIVNFLLSAFVYLRNPKDTVNRIFAFFGSSIILWTLCNYLADNASSHNLLFTRLTFVFGASLASALLILSYVFPVRLSASKRFRYTYTSYALLVFVASLSPLVVTSVEKLDYGVTLRVGSLYFFAVSYLIVTLGLVIKNFVHQYKLGDILEKNQVKLFTTGITIYGVFAILSNVILPIVLENWSSSQYGPIFTVPFVGITAYAMIKHRLFDIRLIVARSLGYALTLVTLVLLYVLIVFGLSSYLFESTDITMTQQLIYIIATMIFGFSLTPLKRFFDRFTNKLFYRDAYDAQDLLDRLNKILVGNIELLSLLHECAELFESTIKAEFCTFIIRKTDKTARRAIGTKEIAINEEDIEKSLQKSNHLRVIVTDNLDANDSDIKRMLQKDSIAVIARLIPSSTTTVTQGYLLLGAKKSGNPYSKHDLRVIEIIANELVIAIQNALRFDEISSFAVTLQQKVSDATGQLRKTNEKLRALDETKDEFISMASHQLRTPLTAVKGYLSMALDGDAGDLNKQQKALLDQAFFSSQRMVYLISDLLNVSRLKTGKFVIESHNVNLANVVKAEIEQLKQVASTKKQKLLFTKPTHFPNMLLDETKLRQVIMNFIDNALHYTPIGGEIQIVLEDKDKNIEFKVIDTGLGVPKHEQHKLFSKFFRADNAKKARPDGTGLGLFMAKKVIIAQGGAVIFSSQENKGSTFGFSIPKTKENTAVK